MTGKNITNSLGRRLPITISGIPVKPFQGIQSDVTLGKFKYNPERSRSKISQKQVDSMHDALEQAGLCDGMTISSHHHFRNGDLLPQLIFSTARQMKIKNLKWFPTAVYPCHEYLIPFLEDSTISHIEGSLTGGLAKYCSSGLMKNPVLFHSQERRYNKLVNGEVVIDIAVIGASNVDLAGNANALSGKSATGSLEYARTDVDFAHKVIVAAENIGAMEDSHIQIEGSKVDYVLKVNELTNPEKILSKGIKITNSPDRLLIAELTARFCEEAGLMNDGFSFQTGSGSVSLAIQNFFLESIERRRIQSENFQGESNAKLVEGMEKGLIRRLLDVQPFDTAGLHSLNNNSNHNLQDSENPLRAIDIAILGAMEMDLDFNANVITHPNGTIVHGMGTWQESLHAKNVIVPASLFKDRVPFIQEKVTTLCGPGELIDVLVTERGIAINPRRKDLLHRMKDSKLPIKSIAELKSEADAICGQRQEIELTDQILGYVEWIDGTLLDVIYKVKD